MAFVHGKGTVVLVGAYDLSADLSEANTTNDMDMAETSTFGNTYKTFIQGLGNSTISLSGRYNSAVDRVDQVLSAAIGSTTTLPVTVANDGYVLGGPSRSIGSNLSSYEVTGSISDVVAISAAFQTTVDSGGKRGQQLLLPSVAVTATGSQVGQGTWGTALGSAAATTNGGFGVLHLVANTRDAGSIVYKIQHSSDTTTGSDGVWVDLVTFTSVGFGVETTEYIQVAAGTTVNKGLRAQYTVTGGTTGSYSAFIGFTRL